MAARRPGGNHGNQPTVEHLMTKIEKKNNELVDLYEKYILNSSFLLLFELFGV